MGLLLRRVCVALLLFCASIVNGITWYDCALNTRYSGASSSSSSQSLTRSSSTFSPNTPLPIPGWNDFERKRREIEREFYEEEERKVQSKRKTTTRALPLISKCASVQVPLDYDAPQNGTIQIFAKCYIASSSSTGQLWMLQGGPGISSYTIEPLMQNVAQSIGTIYDVCTLDFRGVDRSSDLNCVGTQAITTGSPGGCTIINEELTNCRNELLSSTNIYKFSTTEGAKDLAYLIQNYSKSKVAVYGISYGTYWLSRFTQLYPNLADKILFDSVVNPSNPVSTFDLWDKNNDQVIKEYLTRCGKDSFCSLKLTTDPVSFATQTLDKVFNEPSSCPSIRDIFGSRDLFVQYLYNFLQSLSSRPLVPSLIYRLNKCRHKDYQIFSAFVPSRSQGLCDTTQSACLYNTVVFAELFDSTLTAEQLKARNDPLTFNGNISQIFFDQRKLWSTYHDSRYYNLSVSPSPTTKVLILGSDLDSQTPIQGTITFKENINTTSNMVTFGLAKGGGHGVILLTSKDGKNCGLDLISNFLTDSTYDLTCLNNIYTLDFEGNDRYNTMYIGTSDLYDGEITTMLSPAAGAAIAMGVIAFVLLIAVVILGVQYALLKKKI